MCGGGQELNLASYACAGTVLTLHHTPADGAGWQALNLHL